MAERADIDRAPHGRKSSKSGTNENCLYWEFRGDSVFTWNSSRPESGETEYSRGEWEAFIAGVKDGEADWPV